MRHHQPNQKIYDFAAIAILLLGFALRAAYLQESHPYIDEYFTILAAKMVQIKGWPILPSGLFYSHGFLYTYITAILAGLMESTGSMASIVAVEMMYRLPNLLISAVAMAALYGVTKKWFGPAAALLALSLMAIYPHGLVWGARVRMYTLLYLFVPVLVYAFYQMIDPYKPHTYRRLTYTLGLLLAGVLTHNWVVLLVPPLVLSSGFVSWKRDRNLIRSWLFWLIGWVGIGVLVSISVYLQSWGMVVAETASPDRGWQGASEALLSRLGMAADIDGNVKFLYQFVWDNSFNALVLTGVLFGLPGILFLGRAYNRSEKYQKYFWLMVYLYGVFWLAAFEFILLLEPALKQPRYASPLLILAFIIWGGWLAILFRELSTWPAFTLARQWLAAGAIILITLAGLGYLSNHQLPKIFFEGLPALGYDKAFQYVKAHSTPYQTVLTPLPAAAYLYLGQAGYFAAQNAIHTFVHLNQDGILADRWVGAPWLKDNQQLKQVFTGYPLVWIVVDQPSFETQFNSDWKQLLAYNAQKVWEEDGVMVFKVEGLIKDLPTQPDISIEAQLADNLKLIGYNREFLPNQIRLTLFWQVLMPLAEDYTLFVHVRNQANQTVAQADVRPLAGQYPTTRWKTGEQIVDEITIPLPANLPPDTYRLLLGFYRWDTLERLPVMNDTTGENAIELEWPE